MAPSVMDLFIGGQRLELMNLKIFFQLKCFCGSVTHTASLICKVQYPEEAQEYI